MAAKELLANSQDCIEFIPGTCQIVIGGGPSSGVGSDSIYSFTQKSFTFDHVFDTSSTQELIYNQAVNAIIQRFLDGFNATILAYGQTGSGKTYSMGIGLDAINTGQDPESIGIVPRAIRSIFDHISDNSKKHGTMYKSTATVSFLELYNEELVDLLNPRPRSAQGSPTGPSIREDGSGKIVWHNILEEPVNSPQELMSAVQRGTLCRTTGSTDMNATSSRSHAIFTITLKQEFLKADGVERRMTSRLHFVDLAGSERLKRTNAEGDRKKEGISINQGLLALGNVISALGDESRKSSHVPYRDSKLTRMLQDSLGGNSQTLMIACVSPSDLNYGESVNTLHYANRARNIKNRVMINQEWGGGMGFGAAEKEIKALRATVSQLRTEIAMIRAGVIPQSTTEEQVKHLENFGTQFHKRRERDLQIEIDNLKERETALIYKMEKAQFYAFKLSDKIKTLVEECEKAKQERDCAVIEKARILNPAWLDYQKSIPSARRSQQDQNTPNTDKNIDIEDIKIENENLAKEMCSSDEQLREVMQGLYAIITRLRMQVLESEEKYAWQRETMSKLGRIGGALTAWSEDVVENVERPKQKSITAIENEQDMTKNEQNVYRRAVLENIRLKNLDNDINSDRNNEYVNILKNTGIASDDLGDRDETPVKEDVGQEQSDPDVYLIINRIQNDIAQHEALVARIHKRDNEYEVMKKAYEQKLEVLQSKMVQFQTERDLALSKMQAGGNKVKAKTQFDEEKRRLDSQIQEYKRKLGENSRLRSNNRNRTDMLTRELQTTIESLKLEKSRMLQELRRESQKHRDMANASQREIAKLKKREKNALDLSKRLERSNLLQRATLKRKTEEASKTQNKLRNVMNLLKKSATPTKIFKSITSGVSSPTYTHFTRSSSRLDNRNRKRALTGPAITDLLSALHSPGRLNAPESLTNINPSVEVRAQFKKQMVDKELAACVLCRRTQKKLQELHKTRQKLHGEQKELLEERKRIIKAHEKKTGIYDPDSPQYMDERVQAIDSSISAIDEKVCHLEDLLKRNKGIIDEELQGGEGVDLNWENALNLLKSLDRSEMENAIGYFLDDLVSLKVEREDSISKEMERDGMISNLKRMVEVLRTAMLTQQEEMQRMHEPEAPFEADTSEEERIHEQEKRLRDEVLPREPSPIQFLPSFMLRKKTQDMDKEAEAERAGKLSPIRNALKLANFDEKKDDKKMGGSDVFERLASSHTLASQAKVISKPANDPEFLETPI